MLRRGFIGSQAVKLAAEQVDRGLNDTDETVRSLREALARQRVLPLDRAQISFGLEANEPSVVAAFNDAWLRFATKRRWRGHCPLRLAIGAAMARPRDAGAGACTVRGLRRWCRPHGGPLGAEAGRHRAGAGGGCRSGCSNARGDVLQRVRRRSLRPHGRVPAQSVHSGHRPRGECRPAFVPSGEIT